MSAYIALLAGELARAPVSVDAAVVLPSQLREIEGDVSGLRWSNSWQLGRAYVLLVGEDGVDSGLYASMSDEGSEVVQLPFPPCTSTREAVRAWAMAVSQ